MGFAQVKNEVLFDPDISFKAKGLFAYIYAKPDGWQFSSERIAKETKECTRSIKGILKELESAEYLVREKQGNGRVKYHIGWEKKPKCKNDTLGQEPECKNSTVQKAHSAETARISNKEFKKQRVKETKTTTNVVEATPVYGNDDINWILDEFERVMGMKSMGGKKDRFMAKHLLNNFSRPQISAMLIYCASGGQYVPSVGSVEKLWFKRADIVAGIRKFQTNQNDSRKKTIEELTI